MAKKKETLHQKLNYIQSNLKVEKGRTNSFGKYKYRNLDDIFEALKPLMKETKSTVTVTDEIVCINGFNYIKARVNFMSDQFKNINSLGIEDLITRLKSAKIESPSEFLDKCLEFVGYFTLKDVSRIEIETEINIHSFQSMFRFFFGSSRRTEGFSSCNACLASGTPEFFKIRRYQRVPSKKTLQMVECKANEGHPENAFRNHLR